MNLSNKVVVITGASSGFGKVLAEKMSEQNATLILVARSKEKLEKVVQNLNSNGKNAWYYVCDIRNTHEVKDTVKKILQKIKNVDILINNAGIWTDNNIDSIYPDKRKEVIDTNVLGNIQFTQEFLPFFIKKNKGYIFNVISTSGTSESPAADNSFWQTYGATKWALRGFTNALRMSLSKTHIKVTGFYPGGMETNLYETAGLKNSHNLPWMMKPEDIVEIVIFALTRPDDVLMESITVTKVF